MAYETIITRLETRASERADHPAFFEKDNGVWKGTTFAEYHKLVRQAAKALLALGVEQGDIITILGFNRPEWVVMDLAAMAVGGAPAGIYITSSASEVQYITNHAEAPIILVEDEAQLAKVEAQRTNLPHLKTIVTMRGAGASDRDDVLTWEEFLAKGDGVDETLLDDRIANLEPNQLATLIYTSGTTGPPKGVMLTHENLSWTAGLGIDLIEGRHDDILLSYLPLSHIAEQMFTIHLSITQGSTVYFAESIDDLADNLVEVRPTVFFGVPRVWEKFQSGIADKVGEATGAKARIAAWAQDVGRKVTQLKEAGDQVGTGLSVQHALADKLVLGKVRDALGLDRCRIMLSAAAPLNPEVILFLQGFGFTVYEIYGQSEDSGPTSSNLPGKVKVGSVGASLPGIDVKIASDGEILVQGPNVFAGYYKDQVATDEALVDGWLHSGDLGDFDDLGFLTITGRKKDIIITAGGKNIAPKNLEASIKTNQLVSEAVVIGDRRKYLTALVTLDPEHAQSYVDRAGGGDAHTSDAVRASVQATVDAMNAELARVEQVKSFAILPREFTIEDGELTGTLKVKRANVNDNWATTINELYE